jgi:hypothetical protein
MSEMSRRRKVIRMNEMLIARLYDSLRRQCMSGDKSDGIFSYPHSMTARAEALLLKTFVITSYIYCTSGHLNHVIADLRSLDTSATF